MAPGEGWTKLFALFFKVVCYLDIFFRWKLEGSCTVQNWASEGQVQSRGHPTGSIHVEGSWFCPFKGNFRRPCVPVLTTEKVCWDAHVSSQLSFIIAETIPGELSGRPWVLCDSQQQLQHEGIQWPWVGGIWNLTLGVTPPVSNQRQNFSASQDHSNSKFCF